MSADCFFIRPGSNNETTKAFSRRRGLIDPMKLRKNQSPLKHYLTEGRRPYMSSLSIPKEWSTKQWWVSSLSLVSSLSFLHFYLHFYFGELFRVWWGCGSNHIFWTPKSRSPCGTAYFVGRQPAPGTEPGKIRSWSWWVTPWFSLRKFQKYSYHP